MKETKRPSLPVRIRSLPARRWGAVLVISTLPWLMSIPVLGLYSDDYTNIAAHNQTSPCEVLATGCKSGFRPASILLHHAVFGQLGYMTDPWPYHLVSTALHVAVAASLYKLCMLLSLRKECAWFGFMLMLYSPPKNTAVLWATCCGLPVMSLLVIGAFVIVVRELQGSWRLRRVMMAALLFPLSALFYEQAALLGPLFSIAVLSKWRAGWRRLTTLFVASIPLLTILALVWLQFVVGTNRHGEQESGLADRLARMAGLVHLVPKLYYWDLVTVPRLALAQSTITGDFEFSHGAWGIVAGAFSSIWLVAFAISRGFGQRFRETASRSSVFVVWLAGFGWLAWAITVFPAMAFHTSDWSFYVPCLGLSVAAGCLFEIVLRHAASSQWVCHAIRATVIAVALWMVMLTSREMACFAESWRIQKSMIRAAQRDMTDIPAGSLVLVAGATECVPDSNFGKAWVWPRNHDWGFPKGLQHVLNRTDVQFKRADDDGITELVRDAKVNQTPVIQCSWNATHKRFVFPE